MKRYYGIVTVVLLVPALLAVSIGCTNDTSQGTAPSVEETRAIIQGAKVGYPPEEAEGGAEALSAFTGILFIDLFLTVADMYLDTEIFEYQGSDGTYTFSVSAGDDSYTLALSIVWDGGSGMWHYTLSLDGTLNTVVYDNFTIFEMYAAPGGNSGEVTFRNPDIPAAAPVT